MPFGRILSWAFFGPAAAGCACGMAALKEHPAHPLVMTTVAVATAPATWWILGGSIAAVALLMAWHKGWLQAFGASLFTRLARHKMESHPARARVMEVVRRTPGATTADLQELTGLNLGTLLYHLRALGRAGLVRSSRAARQRYWSAAESPPPNARLLAVAHDPVRQALLHIIAVTPGLSLQELARKTGKAPATIHHHLARLAASGLVGSRREGSRVRYEVLAGARAVLGPA